MPCTVLELLPFVLRDRDQFDAGACFLGVPLVCALYCSPEQNAELGTASSPHLESDRTPVLLQLFWDELE
jgi:hypothetical protein